VPVYQLDRTEAHRVMRILVARSEPAPSPKGIPDTSPCLIWQGCTVTDGYGFIRAGGHQMHTQRAAWLSMVGPIGTDDNGRSLDVYLLCQVKTCVNPKHLELVTHAEARLRQEQKRTHCNHGHELTKANTVMRPPKERGKKPYRACRTCATGDQLRYQARRKAARARERETAT